ncbi:Hypothetical predicted protein [Pelobates cultripes]|uniref:Uncharacterized protein n=1 Tax=Pelobates cultripes TaxID=61616 RepID=A0AAD1R7P3_PELCU|nr:Hypothetical predicted protein [Pelobates cultripes]
MDIGTLPRVTPLRRPTKMAPMQEDSELASEESEQEDPRCPAEQRLTSRTFTLTDCEAVLRRSSPETRPEKVPPSKADIQNMLKEMKSFFATALIGEDLAVMTARVQALEDNGNITRGKQEDMEAEENRLKQANLSMEGRLAVLEDSKRQQNLQVRSVLEDITTTKVPYYQRKMLSSMLSLAKAKAMQLDYHYRVPISTKAPAGGTGLTDPKQHPFADTDHLMGTYCYSMGRKRGSAFLPQIATRS